MTVILSIKRSGATSVVHFDDGTSFRCTRDFIRRSRLAPGQRIEPLFIDRLRESASYDLAVSEAERLVRRGRFSRGEIVSRLRQAELSITHINTALDALEARGELDDQAIALKIARRSLQRALVRDPNLSWNQFRSTHGRRLALRGFGPAQSSAALRQAWSEIVAAALAPRTERA